MNYAILIIFTLLAIIAISFALYGGKIQKTMDSISIYRVASSLVIASILSGVISLYAIVFSLSGSGTPVISSQDAIVDILGILVTVLMGWNIISLVDFKKKADEIDDIKSDFKNVIAGFTQLNFDTFSTNIENRVLLDNCINTLDGLHSCLSESIRHMAEDKLMNKIKKVCDDMEDKQDLVILPGQRNFYMHVLNHVDHRYTKDTKEFLGKTRDSDQNLDEIDQGAVHISVSRDNNLQGELTGSVASDLTR